MRSLGARPELHQGRRVAGAARFGFELLPVPVCSERQQAHVLVVAFQKQALALLRHLASELPRNFRLIRAHQAVGSAYMELACHRR